MNRTAHRRFVKIENCRLTIFLQGTSLYFSFPFPLAYVGSWRARHHIYYVHLATEKILRLTARQHYVSISSCNEESASRESLHSETYGIRASKKAVLVTVFKELNLPALAG